MRRWTRVGMVVLILCLAAPAGSPGAPAARQKSPTGKLTPRLAAISKPPLRSASPARQAARLSLPAHGAGSLMRSGHDLVVSARLGRISRSALRDLRLAGARILHVSPAYRTATLAVRPRALRRVAGVPGVEIVVEELRPLVAGRSEGGAARDASAAAAAACTGAATSEGDAQLHANSARAKYGVSGTGVEVGILSDSFDAWNAAPTHADDDVASGDLPGTTNPCGHLTPVDVLAEGSGIDEGRAMAQLVHDLAPGAALAFATANGGQTVFADNIRDLQTAGADVIVDDVIYFAEPFFQNGIVGVATDDVVAAGATYFSAAGNDNVILNGKNVSSWEAPAFRTTSCPTGLPSYATNCMDFDLGGGADNDFAIEVPSGAGFILDLQWAEPWYGVTTDIDVYALVGNVIKARSESCNFLAPGCASETQNPFELLSYSNPTGQTKTVRVAINRYAGSATPRLKFVLIGADGISSVEYNQSVGSDVVGPTIFGHSGPPNGMSVGAVPYNDSATAESYSSRGPVTHYFGPVVGTSPAPPLGSPQVLAKPDVAATDGAQTTFFYSLVDGVYRFYGTSAAAPHAAAVAALQLDGFPSATPVDVMDAQRTTASAVGAFGPEAVGAGLVRADAAVASLLPAASISDVAKPEGNSGTKTFNFTVTLDQASAAETRVRYATADGSAQAGSDYVAASGSVRFAPGVTSRTVKVTVNGDTALEGDETFTVKLKRPTRLVIADASGVGTIQNDD